MNTKPCLAAMVSVSIAIAMATFGVWTWLTTAPELRAFESPSRADWKPVGPRRVGRHDHFVIPEPTAFYTMHVGIDDTDEL
jgi:hypothetical protein